MEIKAAGSSGIDLLCPTCGAKYRLEKYVEGQRYSCKRCSASLMFGKFALLTELGRGGFGVVYKAWQADLQRIVALKFLHSDGDDSTERFTREARIAANLTHPNIAAIYEVGNHEGKLYITMQFVDGITVNKSDLSLRDAANVIRDAALAVDYAHARDIIHRDIKPHNIMLTRGEPSGTSPGDLLRRVYVMDFGLARSVSKGSTLTTDGQILGTPAFMSPEQAQGLPCDGRSDVYSLGATLYSMTAKRPPFEANTPVQVLMLVATGTPRPPSEWNSEIDKGLESIILKAMECHPENRYPTAARLAADLTRWLQGEAADVGPTIHLSSHMAVPKASPAKRRGAMVAIGLILALVGAGGLFKLFVLSPRPGSSSQRPNPPGESQSQKAPDAEAEAAKVVLEVRTDPDKAQIRLGGLEKTAPCKFTRRELPPGPYTLRIEMPGYESLAEPLTLEAGGASVPIERKLVELGKKVAFRLVSDPPGARILIEGKDTGLKTPADIHRDLVAGTKAPVELELDGYQTVPRVVEIQETPHEERITLEPLTAAFHVHDLAPQAFVYLFTLPPGVRSPAALLGLWSENVESLERSLQSLEAHDAALALGRLRDIATRGDARVREKAAQLARGAAAGSASAGLQPDQSLTADVAGNVTFQKAWVKKSYRILATTSATSDFLSDEVRPSLKSVTRVKADMPVVASIAWGVRPRAGQFQVTLGDGAIAGQVLPEGPPLRLPAGTVTLRYLPPPGDSLLHGFTQTAAVAPGFEITGNLYWQSGGAFEQEGKLETAVRAYTKVLEEKNYPGNEEDDRGRLPDRIQNLYRSWIDAQVKQSRTVGGDLQSKVEEARKRPPAEMAPLLLELYAAKGAAKEIRGAAAAGLAYAEGRLKQPYPAMEWMERALREGADPGPDGETAVSDALRGFPGLAERWTAAVKALAVLRRPPPRRPAFLGARVAEQAGRGLRVTATAKGFPAEDSGLKAGDILTEMGGSALRSPSDLDGAIAAHFEGDVVEVKFERGPEKLVANLKLAGTPEKEPEFAMPPSRLGVISSVDARYGLFVKLDPDAVVAQNDVLEVVRAGEVVGEATVIRVFPKRDTVYPNGSAEIRRGKVEILKGDEVRKKK
jgi:serine/threonine protein kinase